MRHLQQGAYLTCRANRPYTAGNVSSRCCPPLPRSEGLSSKITIKQVASHAGVGIATVSRVLNDELDVAPATRERVLAVCAELGYTRSNLGRSLKTGATGNIGVAIMSRHAPVILNPFYMVVVGGIEQELNRAGQHLLLSSLRRKGDLLELAEEGRVDGLLVVGCDIDTEDLENLRKSGRPVVLVDHEHPGLPSVSIDHEGGGRLAARHLLQSGVNQPAFVTENLTNPNFQARLRGFRLELEENGVELHATGIAQGGDSWDGGYYAMRQLLEQGKAPDGVFAANDPAALSAMRALAEAGHRVPEDTRVIGFDDIHLATQSGLTTIRVDKLDLGRTGARLLLEQIDAGPQSRKLQLGGELVRRVTA